MRNQRSASLPSSWAASSSDTPDPGAGGSCPRGKGPPTAQPFGGARSPHPPRLPRRSLRSRRVAGPRGTRGSRTSRSPVPPASRRRRMSERLTNDVTVDAALDALRAIGATGEVFLREAQSGSVEIKEGAIEAVIARGERGVGIRVLDDQRLGFAYTSDLSTDGIRACVDIARRMSSLTERDEDLALATRPIDDADLDIYQAGIVDRPLSERGAIALAVEEAARAADPRVKQFRKTTYSDSESMTISATP